VFDTASYFQYFVDLIMNIPLDWTPLRTTTLSSSLDRKYSTLILKGLILKTH